MSVRLLVAVTDGDWFDHLRNRTDLPEVSFWSPSATTFRALSEGELFLFKLHSPRNYVVGGGVFAYANTMPCSLAWSAFGEANGAASLGQMRSRVARYRRSSAGVDGDFEIGCRILTQPFFWPEEDWIPVPDNWAPNIVSFKGYSTDEMEGRRLWYAARDASGAPTFAGVGEEQARYGEPMLIRPRLGQGAFRVLVTDSYERRCAVSGERTLPALEAAHIRPFADGGPHQASNGILLRRDIHSLFDAGYVTITPTMNFEVSRRIREEFENGRMYYGLHGRQITLPIDPRRHPERAALSWHNENRFRA
ncbi:MAG: HNH endonuclease [Pseudomonadota bacterium]